MTTLVKNDTTPVEEKAGDLSVRGARRFSAYKGCTKVISEFRVVGTPITAPPCVGTVLMSRDGHWPLGGR